MRVLADPAMQPCINVEEFIDQLVETSDAGRQIIRECFAEHFIGDLRSMARVDTMAMGVILRGKVGLINAVMTAIGEHLAFA